MTFGSVSQFHVYLLWGNVHLALCLNSVLNVIVIFAKLRLKLYSVPGNGNIFPLLERSCRLRPVLLCVRLQSWYYYLPSQWPVSARIPISRSGLQFHIKHLLYSQLLTQCSKPLATAANSSIWILDHNQKFHKPITTEYNSWRKHINFKVYYQLFPSNTILTASMWPV